MHSQTKRLRRNHTADDWSSTGQDQGGTVEEVNVPFRISIPSGHSGFTISVPQNYIEAAAAYSHEQPRRFFFSHLEVMPDFYAAEAEKLALDADQDLNKTVQHNVQVKIHCLDPKTTYGDTYDHGTKAINTIAFLQNINKHFETQKPAFAYTTPFFIDWIDRELEKTSPSTKYVPLQPMVFYGEELDQAKHHNALPLSARTLENANNYLPPVTGNMEPEDLYADRIRLRLWLAPHTRAVFSNVRLFVDHLGFKTDDMGFLKQKQYHLLNDTDHWLPMAVADAAPKIELPGSPFKLTMQASDVTNTSRIKGVAMTLAKWLDNIELASILKQAFQQSSRSFNTKFSLGYDSTSETFSFQFPEASDKVAITLLCEPDFAHRLGFGYTSLIAKGMTAKSLKKANTVNDSHLSALSVVYDTGPIICQLDQMSSNTTSGLTDKTVASLYPHRSGTLRMPPLRCACALESPYSSHSFPLHINAHSTEATYPAKFNLKRIYDDGSCTDFQWKCNAFAFGTLLGSKL